MAVGELAACPIMRVDTAGHDADILFDPVATDLTGDLSDPSMTGVLLGNLQKYP